MAHEVSFYRIQTPPFCSTLEDHGRWCGMGWQDQGRQEHGWFGHGTSEKVAYDEVVASKSLEDRSLSVAYGVVAVLSPAQRKRLETQYHYGTLGNFTEMMTALMRANRLDLSCFASLFFDRAADDPIVEALHGASLAAGLATSHAEMREASEGVAKAIDLVGIDRWPRFVTQVQARADDPVTVAAVDHSQRFDSSRSDAIRPVYPFETAIGIGAAGIAGGVGAAVRAGAGAVLRQILPENKPSASKPPPIAGPTKASIEDASRASVRDKLNRYTLNLEHRRGGSKARWFQQALGFTRENSEELARQLVFDEKSAIQTGVTEFGTKYNQTIAVVGANGRTIPVTTAWLKGTDGVVRLVTALPGK